MVQRDYPSYEQVVHIDWHTSQSLANGSGAARASYYGVSGVPDVWFDGTDRRVGAGDSLSAYAQYKPIVDAHYVSGSKAILSAKLDLNSDTMTGTITVDVEVAPGETIGSPGNCRIRAALYEDNILLCCEPGTGNAFWNYIGRLMITETTLTASLPGETQQVVRTFAINPAWKIANLRAVVFVQRDTNKAVLQAAQAAVQYDCEVADLDPPVAKITTGSTDFDSQLTYTGATDDDVVLTLDETALPVGWDADIVWNSTTYPSTLTIPSMTKGQTEAIAVRVTPGGIGVGTVGFTVRPASNGSNAVGAAREYHTFMQTPAILFVDDDNGAAYESLFENAILGAGYHSVTTEVQTRGNPLASYLANFDAVVWTTGELPTQTIGPNVQAEIQAYLDGGGTFFVSSQGYLNHQGITTFTSNYLRVSAFTSNVGAPAVTGVPGDPIGDGLSFSVTPPFTNAADAITPAAGGVIWLTSGANNVGVRYDSGVFRTVFMTPPFEGLAPADGALLMDRVLDWLLQGLATDVRPLASAPTGSLFLAPNAPNPFRGSTTLRFAVPASGPVSLAVFDVAGRRVASLLDRPLDAGTHSVVWDGRDGAGMRVASGVYLVRLTAGGETVSRGMVRVE